MRSDSDHETPRHRRLDGDNRVAKYQDFDTEAAAVEHVARVAEVYPQAFVVADPGGPCRDWRVDPEAQALSLDPPPEIAEREAREAQLAYRKQRAEAYRARLGKEPDNTREETIGDVLDAVIKAMVTGDASELQAIAAKVQAIKAEIPKPAEPE
jgi:hypothetical protein